jgi:DNA polymerase III subunit delta'
MKFSEIQGQKDIIGKLISSVRSERVSHAQLFAGPEGCGGLALALAYAQYVSCENRSPHDSCGTCKSCVKYEKLIHPDLHFVFPVIKDKKSNESVSDNYITQWRVFAKQTPYAGLNKWLASIDVGNAQGLIFASEASEIVKKLSLKAFESDFKIMIIWLPEKMHLATANKLLKLVEEPPEKTLFILVSEEPDKVVPTLFSRCQLIKIPSVNSADISGYLVEKLHVHKSRADDISRIASGNISRAVELCEDEESSLVNLERFKNLMRYAWKRDILSLTGWSEEMSAIGREPQKSFISFSLRLIRENLMLTLDQMKNRLVFMTGDEAEFSSKFHPFITQENIYSLADEMNLAFAHIEANGNSKIVFLDLALKITRLIIR